MPCHPPRQLITFAIGSHSLTFIFIACLLACTIYLSIYRYRHRSSSIMKFKRNQVTNFPCGGIEPAFNSFHSIPKNIYLRPNPSILPDMTAAGPVLSPTTSNHEPSSAAFATASSRSPAGWVAGSGRVVRYETTIIHTPVLVSSRRLQQHNHSNNFLSNRSRLLTLDAVHEINQQLGALAILGRHHRDQAMPALTVSAARVVPTRMGNSGAAPHVSLTESASSGIWRKRRDGSKSKAAAGSNTDIMDDATPLRQNRSVTRRQVTYKHKNRSRKTQMLSVNYNGICRTESTQQPPRKESAAKRRRVESWSERYDVRDDTEDDAEDSDQSDLCYRRSKRQALDKQEARQEA